MKLCEFPPCFLIFSVKISQYFEDIIIEKPFFAMVSSTLIIVKKNWKLQIDPIVVKF